MSSSESLKKDGWCRDLRKHGTGRTTFKICNLVNFIQKRWMMSSLAERVTPVGVEAFGIYLYQYTENNLCLQTEIS